MAFAQPGKGLLCRAAALLVSGVVLMRLGDAAGGRQRLPKALKLAHASLQNHQLVTQACLCLPLRLSLPDYSAFLCYVLTAMQAYGCAADVSLNHLLILGHIAWQCVWTGGHLFSFGK